jgi:hypothetical protein
MDPWRDIEIRPTPDLGGKPVDIHFRPAIGSALAFVADKAPGRDVLLGEILMCLALIRDARNRRIRERRFNVWYGTATTLSEQKLAVIMFPDRFDYNAWRLLASLRKLPGFIEQGQQAVLDMVGGPIARYDHGTITSYVSPSAPVSASAFPDTQMRSAVVVDAPRKAPTRWMLPPSGRAPRWHTQDVWEENHERILKFVWDLQAAGTYDRLAHITEKHFGIAVREDLDLSDARYGILRAGFLDTDTFAIPFGIFLRGDLPDGLKYIVLAHELSHYAFHFPLLYLGALVDDLSRGVPEARPIFEAAATEHLDRNALEFQADAFASNFLIPPRYDVAALSRIYNEMGRAPSPAELAWRFLQPLIPGAQREPVGWSNLSRMIATATDDLASIDDAPETLYARMLRATVARVEGHGHDPDGRVARGFDALQETFETITDAVFEAKALAGPRSGRATLAARLSVSDQATADAPFPDDMRGDRYTSLAPLRLRPGQLARAIHLVPAPSNPAGDRAGEWTDRHHLEEGPYTIAKWRTLLEDDVAIRLYRHESWQPEIPST